MHICPGRGCPCGRIDPDDEPITLRSALVLSVTLLWMLVYLRARDTYEQITQRKLPRYVRDPFTS